jgi:Tol biopolymer transport system component
LALTPGTRLGAYDITAQIGEGGMGQVFRATDTRLKRQVAIKILPPSVAGDHDRLVRFQREAEVLALLNHPNIAAIYGLEDNDGIPALVMELVEGRDLSQLIARGALPLDEALPIAKQIAEALEAAHDQGIIHRDLKPANVKVRSDGTVKVLDFGLAKAMEPAWAAAANAMNSPTVPMHDTRAGIILGTPAYMSPEQANGKQADQRADIWAFGVLLWEMLTGESLFGHGASTSEMLADVLRARVVFERVPAGPLRQLLQRCLDRDVKMRLRDIGEARVALGRVSLSDTAMDAAPQSAPAAKTSTLPRMVATAAISVLAGAAGLALWGWLTPAPAQSRPLIHFTTATPQGDGNSPIAVSRDGSRLAFVGMSGDQIYTRTMDDPVARPVPGTEHGMFPAFSPDGQSLAFVTGPPAPFQMKKVPIAGGAALTLVDSVQTTVPMSWGEDGNILLGGPELQRVSDAGGTPVAIAKADAARGEIAFVSPQLLPGGKYILASVLTPKGLSAFRVVAVEIATGKLKVLMEGVGDCWFAQTASAPGVGHLVYALNGSLFAAAFNTATLQVGPAAPVLEGVRDLGGLTHAGFSRSGTLVYPSRGNTISGARSTLTWVDRTGTEQPLSAPPRPYVSPRISPNGEQVAFHVDDLTQRVDVQIWVLDLLRGTTNRLTFDRSNQYPVWTADGKRLIYLSSTSVTNPNGTLASLPAASSGQPVTLMGEGMLPAPTSASRDGKLVIGVRGPGLTRSGRDIWVLRLDGTGKAEPFLDNRVTRGDLQFSPDGKWVEYESNESGRNEIYVVPYPGPGGKSQVSTDGGAQPRWNRNGRELFFRSGTKMMAVDVETGAAFRAGTARVLFEKVAGDYDVSPDGRRFLMLKPAAAAGDSGELHVIVNWFDDLRQRVPLLK